MKILNLYAGIGGNRKLWPKGCKVTSVENNKDVAWIYADLFPKDKVIIDDAHNYLLKNYREFDFIWSSPPCPTHSVCNNFQNAQGIVRYPDMRLYQEILFLKHWFKGKWVVENVKPYYNPLIHPQEAGRHYFWANFIISNKKIPCDFNTINARSTTRAEKGIDVIRLQEFHGFDLKDYPIGIRRKVLRNCVNPKLGLHIFNCAFKEKQEVLIK
jgi:DNA (cytosine-5)-methyltransferase 1